MDVCASQGTLCSPTVGDARGARSVAEHSAKRAAIAAHVSTFTRRASHRIRRRPPGRKRHADVGDVCDAERRTGRRHLLALLLPPG